MKFCNILAYILHFCVIVTGNDTEKRMLGGSDVSPNLYPFAALVLLNGSTTTGTIVARKWVLTINEWRGKELQVRGLVKAGHRFFSTSVEERESHAQIINVEKVYNSPYDEYIGSALLLLLEKPFIFDKTVEAAVFNRNRWIHEKDTCFVVGYGGEGNQSYALLVGNDWPVQRCQTSFGVDQLCSPFGIHGVPCSGDYGAPAVCGNCVTGILLVHDGRRDCPLADRYEFLFVPYILPWIKRLVPEVKTVDCSGMGDLRRTANFSPKSTTINCLVTVTVLVNILTQFFL